MDGIGYKVDDLLDNKMVKHYLNQRLRQIAGKLTKTRALLYETTHVINLIYFIALFNNNKQRKKILKELPLKCFICLIVMKWISEITVSRKIKYDFINLIMQYLFHSERHFTHIISKLRKLNLVKKVSKQVFVITEPGEKFLKDYSRNLTLESNKLITQLTKLTQNY